MRVSRNCGEITVKFSVAELPKTNSVLTIVGGKIVYDAKVLK
jgi:hypothetical protein